MSFVTKTTILCIYSPLNEQPKFPSPSSLNQLQRSELSIALAKSPPPTATTSLRQRLVWRHNHTHLLKLDAVELRQTRWLCTPHPLLLPRNLGFSSPQERSRDNGSYSVDNNSVRDEKKEEENSTEIKIQE